jgi:hypothetical protein
MNPMGCVDVGISNEVDSRGLRKWSIHLFREPQDAILLANGDILPETPRSIFRCQGVPHNYVVQVILLQAVPHDLYHKQSVRVTGPWINNTDLQEAFYKLHNDVPVDNTSDQYTSQLWVFDALDALYDMELFPDDDFEEAHALLCGLHQEVGDLMESLDDMIQGFAHMMDVGGTPMEDGGDMMEDGGDMMDDN